MFEFEKVTTTYRGSDHACRCGCRGDYADANVPAEYNRAKRRWREVMHQHSMFPVDIDGGGDEYYLNLSLPHDRAITVYFSCK